MFNGNSSRTLLRWFLLSGLTSQVALTTLSAQAQPLLLNLTDYSDSESALIPQTETYDTSALPAGQAVQAPPATGTTFELGGAALFTSAVNSAQDPNAFNLNINDGDLILPGPQLEASLNQYNQGKPFYETDVLNATKPDAIILGNHDFDLGPQITKDVLVDPTTNQPVAPILSANLVIPPDNPLYPYVQSNTVVTKSVGGVSQSVGVIGINTPTLPAISSVGNITTIGDVAGTPGFQTLVDLVKQQVISLNNKGVKDIVVGSHLQTIDNEEALLKGLGQTSPSGLGPVQVAAVVAGGNHITQTNLTDPIQPINTADKPVLKTPFPIIYNDSTGQPVNSLSDVAPGQHATLLITSAPSYTYLANLKLQLDDNGDVTSVLPGTRNIPVNNLAYKDANGNPIPGSALTPDPTIQAQVEVPVAASVAALKAIPAATTEVRLSSLREEVRSKSTDLGSLIADSVRQSAINLATTQPSAGVDPSKILVGIQNGGGIRNDLTFLPGSTLSKYDTYQILPFTNLISVVKDVTGNELLDILERAVSSQQCALDCDPSNPNHIEGGGGQFLQISGLKFTYDPTAQQQVVSNGVITNPGDRILSITLDPNNNGQKTSLIYDITKGGFQDGDATKALFDLAVINFTADGGDGFTTLQNIPSDRKVTFSSPAATYQQAFNDYLTNNLGGNVTAADIPDGSTRITAALTSVPEPSNLLGLGVAILAFYKLAARKRSR